MDERSVVDVLLAGFSPEDEAAMVSTCKLIGRNAVPGDPVVDGGASFVFAAAYDENALRAHRAAALDDPRPWCFCVPELSRGVVAHAAAAREGRLLLLPPEGRELKRVLAAQAEEAKERSAGDAAFSGLEILEASFSWKSSAFDVSRVGRRLARLLLEAGFYADRSGEDECALALEEALVNALEHGNLGLDSSLRPDDPLAEDRYESEKERRLADPAYGDRLLRLRLSVGAGEARLELEDEGEGFDVAKADDSPSGLEVSGKGFWLIKRPFDEAAYNAKGNMLTLVRRRPGAARPRR